MADSKKQVIQKSSRAVQSKIRSSISITSFEQCVEELVLNALDSAATCIAVRVNASTGYIQVVDNGSGISSKSMKLVGERYTSSKSFSSTKRRQSCHGYRGEALASIAFLCKKLQIISRCEDDDNNDVWCKTCEDNSWSLEKQDEPRPSSGTTVTVTKLFDQTPIKKDFKTGSRTIDSVLLKLKCLAIVHCSQASFSCRDARSGQIILNTGRVKSMKEAVQAMYGNSYGSKLKPIAGTHDQLQVEGFVSSDAYSSSKLRVVSLNKNILRTNRFYQVIERELKKSLIKIPDDQNQKKATPGNEKVVRQRVHYFYVINLRYDSKLFDGSLEPDKAKVEFESWDKVTDSLTKLIRWFLFTNNLNKGVDTDGYQMNCIADRPAPAYLSVGSESQAASGTAMLCESGEELPDLQDGSVKEGVLAGSKKAKKRQVSQSLSKNKSFEILHNLPTKSGDRLPSTIKDCSAPDEEDCGKPDLMLLADSMFKTATWVMKHFSNTEAPEHHESLSHDQVVHTPTMETDKEDLYSTSFSNVFATPLFPKIENRPIFSLNSKNTNIKPWCGTPLETLAENILPNSAPGRFAQHSLKRHIKDDALLHFPSKRTRPANQHSTSSFEQYIHWCNPCHQITGPAVGSFSSAVFHSPFSTPPVLHSLENRHIPSYATPLRSSKLARCTFSSSTEFTSLSPALQRIFAPL